MADKYLITTKRAIAVGASVIALIAFFNLTDFTVVKSDQLAVVRNFGVVQEEPAKPGAHLHWSWDKYEIVPLQFDDALFTANDQSDLSSVQFISADGYVNDLPLSISWAVDPSNLTYVKAHHPGLYSERLPVAVRTAVRDVMSKTRYDDGSMMDRAALEPKLRAAIIVRTSEYYQGMGFGDRSNKIVRYGMLSIRGMTEPGEITANKVKIIEAQQAAQIAAAGTRVPDGHTVASYTAVLKAKAFAKAAEDGNLTATVVDGGNVGVLVKGK
jgi:regulator of protease activity HflC (stomatin/prohibitin superfamily)